MKRFLALAALVLGLVACQTEPEGLNVNVGGEQETYVTVSLPETTRANSALGAFDNVVASNGYTIRYVFEVYYGETGVQKQVLYSDSKSVSFPVRLVPGRHYNFVAWADVVPQGNVPEMGKALPYDSNVVENHYNANNLNAITLNNTWVAMDETRDAYTGFYDTASEGDNNKYTGSSSINIRMTRPFAKLRVITTDMVELGNLNITPVSAKVTYSAFSHESFNALVGTYSGEISNKTHTYTIADYADFANTAKEDSHKVLFTDYFFADDNDVVKFELDVYEGNVDNQNATTLIKHNDFKTDIPAQRNYLTTIQGNILTDGNNITVTVENDGKFENDGDASDDAPYYQETISSADEFLAALNKTGEFIVISDITIADAGTVVKDGQVSTFATRAGDKTIVDLNGHNIKVKNTGTGAITKVDSGKTVAFVGEGEIILEEGSKGSFILNEGTIDVACASVVSNIENIKVFDGGDYTNHLDELRNAFKNGGEHTMKYDVTIDDTLTLEAGKTLVLNLNGKTIAQTKECTGNYNMMYNKGSLTITGNGKISFKDTGAGDPSFGWGSYTLRNDGTLVVENGTIEHLGKQNPGGGQPNVHMYCAIFQYSGSSVINGGTISTPTYRSARLWNGDMTINGGNFVGQLWLQAVSDNANLTINGGTFAPCGNDGSSVFVSNSGKSVTCAINGGYFESKIGMSEALKCISGGEFTTAAKDATSTNLLADGYQFAQLENGNWTVEFVISNVEQLKAFRDAVDDGATFEGKTVKLGADIDLYETDENDEAKCFDPIGSYRFEKAFMGTFDGQGYTIKNLNQNTWALNNGYYYNDCGLGLFGALVNAKIQNLTIDDAHISGESALCGIITAYAENTTFENIAVKNSDCADYQYYAGGIVGWASGKHQYINCDVDASTIIGGQWGDFGNSNGGIIGGAASSAEILMKDCDVACRIDAVNDVVSTYHYYAYRCCGMLIGNTNQTQVINETPYAAAPQLTCENVTVTYGDWMNYHYCEFGEGTYAYVRVEAGISVDPYVNIRYGHPTDANGNKVVDHNHAHNDGEDHHICLPFDQLLGGGPNGDGRNPVYGLASFPGVTVVYPAEYTCEICREQHNVK